MPTTAFLLAGLAVALGGLVQGGVGVGVGIIAAPVVTLADPAIMPGAMLVTGAVLPVFVLVREVRAADWPGISWALAGRFAGTLAGVWIIAAFPAHDLGAVVGLVVLAMVAVSARHGALPRNRWTLLTAGLFSGATGTATSIGGPPVALLYQDDPGPRVRASLSAFLILGNTVALGALAATGHLPGRDVTIGVAFLGFAVVGFAAAGTVRRFLDRGHLRLAVLMVAAASAAILLAHSLIS